MRYRVYSSTIITILSRLFSLATGQQFDCSPRSSVYCDQGEITAASTLIRVTDEQRQIKLDKASASATYFEYMHCT